MKIGMDLNQIKSDDLPGGLKGDAGSPLTDPPKSGLGELVAGDVCPSCGKGQLDYDGMLYLTCPSCGYSLGGCFT